MANGNILSKQNVLIGAGLGVVGLIIFVVWYRNSQAALFDAIMKAIDDTSTVKGTSADIFSQPYWDPHYLAVSGHSPATIDVDTAQTLNEQIQASKGTLFLPDDISKVIAVFQKLGNKTDIAKLADAWRVTYGQAMVDFLQAPGFLDKTGVLFSDRHNYTDDLASTINALPS